MAEGSQNITDEPLAPGATPNPGRRAARVPRWEAFTLTAWFVVFSVLAEYFPRTGDDWAWGSHEGTDRLAKFFQGINGRYGGDLAIIGLTRSGPVAALVVSAVVCASLFLVLHLASNRTPLGYAVAAALFLLMPRGVWRESVVWLAGFVNYAVAAFAFLCFFAVVQAEWHGRWRKPGMVRLAMVALGAFAGQFFIEHVTLCICVVSLILTVLLRRRDGRFPRYTSAWTVGAFIGAAVMFSNSAYGRAASGSGYQQAVSLSGPHALHRIAVRTLDYLPTQAVVWNIAFNGVLAVLLVALVALSGNLGTRAGKAVVVLAAGYLIVSYGLSFIERNGHHTGERIRAFATVAALLMLAALVVSALSIVRSNQRRWTVLVACTSLVCMVGPLILVNPVGPRQFYPTYLVLLVLVSVIAAEVRERAPALERRLAWAPVQLVSIGLISYLLVVYVTIHNAIDHRVNYVRAQVQAGQTQVNIAPLPYSYFVHNGDPFFSVLYSRFKEYYSIPQELKLRLEPNPWLRSPGKESKPAP